MSTALAILALILAALVAAGCIAFQLQVRAIRRTVADLEARIASLDPAPTIPPDLVATFGSGTRRLITVEILNPIQLATSRVKVAAILGAMRPSLLHRVVYTQAVKQISEQLEEEGVVAEVRIHAAR